MRSPAVMGAVRSDWMALMSEQLRKVAVDELGKAQTWPGVTRQEAFATQSM